MSVRFAVIAYGYESITYSVAKPASSNTTIRKNWLWGYKACAIYSIGYFGRHPHNLFRNTILFFQFFKHRSIPSSLHHSKISTEQQEPKLLA